MLRQYCELWNKSTCSILHEQYFIDKTYSLLPARRPFLSYRTLGPNKKMYQHL